MSSVVNKLIRRCSVCHAPGHTKLACPEIKRRSSSTFVPIVVSHAPSTSPHILNVAPNHQNPLAEVEPYQASSLRERASREVVDLAAMVRKANVQEKERRSTVIALPEDSTLSLSIPALTIPTHVERISWRKRRQQERAEARAAGNYSIWQPKQFIFATIALAILVIIPYPAIGYYRKIQADSNQVVEYSTNAFLSLQSSTVAAFHSNIAQAEYDLNAALSSFSSAEDLLDREHRALVYVGSMLPVIGEKVASREHLLVAGHQIALGNTYLVKGVGEAMNSTVSTTVDRLAILRRHVRSATPQYESALKELGQVEPSAIPVEYQNSFKDFKILFSAFIHDMQNMTSVLEGLETMLGNDDLKRYLILFQNNHELRPTGGFVGSFAVVDIQKGKVLSMEIPGGGSYDVQGQLDTFLKPPVPLQLINYRWEFQDGNWFPDFAASAQKMSWFYQHSRGTTIDGVIAVNATVLERILDILGPVENKDFKVKLDPGKALDTLQRAVELDYDKVKNQPKAVIGSVFEDLMARVRALTPLEIIPLVTELHTSLTQKEIQVYMNDPKIQMQFRDFGWSGEITPTKAEQDYLFVVDTNVGGGKSDAKITETIEHQAEVQTDGSIIDTVIVHRVNAATPKQQFYGDPNIDYVRVYVPKGAQLLEAGGFIYPAEESFLVPETWYKDDTQLKTIEIERGTHSESGTRITEEFGKTVFGNWVVTQPASSTEIYFRYKLPFKAWNVNDSGNKTKVSRYSLLLQKQSGITPQISSQVIYPHGWHPVWRTDGAYELGTNGAVYNDILKVDQPLGVVMQSS